MADTIESLREANRILRDGLLRISRVARKPSRGSRNEQLQEIRDIASEALNAEIDSDPREAWKMQLMPLSPGETAHLFRFVRERAVMRNARR